MKGERMSHKKKIIYEGSILANIYSTKNSDRTGVFFVAYNLYLQFVQQNQYDIILYCDSSVKNLLEDFLEDHHHTSIPLITEKDNHKNYHATLFFSPFNMPPEKIKYDKSIVKYTYLHDVTPLANPKIETPNFEWFRVLEENLTTNDYYLYNSKYTQFDFSRFYKKIDQQKTRIAYLAANENFYHCKEEEKIKNTLEKYNIPSETPYIFSLCTLQPRKNLIHVVKSFIAFIKKNKIQNLNFVLGGGQWDSFIEALDEELEELEDYKKYIIKTGYIEDEDLAPLFSGAFCHVYASLYEGFGLPILEAMQCGCPVIASNRTSMPEVLGEAGILVDPQDKVELILALERFYFDKSFRLECVEKSLARSKQFSWQHCYNDISSFMSETEIQALMNQKKSPSKRNKKSSKTKTNLVGKKFYPDKTIFHVFGLSLVQKYLSDEEDQFCLLGIPLVTWKRELYHTKIYFLGVVIKKELNFRSIENEIDLYTGSFSHALYQFGRRLDSVLELNELLVDERIKADLSKQIEELHFHKLLKKSSKDLNFLESELKAVSKNMLQRRKNGE